MASYVLIRHRVRDFVEWKKEYDKHLAKRNEATLTERQLLHGSNDPNEVVVLFEVGDMKRAKAFAESADLRETMQKAGVLDRPDVHFLND